MVSTFAIKVVRFAQKNKNTRSKTSQNASRQCSSGLQLCATNKTRNKSDLLLKAARTLQTMSSSVLVSAWSCEDCTQMVLPPLTLSLRASSYDRLTDFTHNRKSHNIFLVGF